MQNKVPEWHVVYKEWAIHTPTGRLRHIPCKRFLDDFAKFKRIARMAVLNKATQQIRYINDEDMHNRRAILMNTTEPVIHRCKSDDPFEEIVEIVVPSMVVEIAICYMKV